MKVPEIESGMKDPTTITIPRELKERLLGYRRHPRDTIYDILSYVLDLADTRKPKPEAKA